MDFKASEYQEDIFDFTKYGYGNAVISAVAGSGKSTTIIKLLEFIKKERRVLFLAFNSAIVEELKKKITREKTDIKTLHSLGFSILKSNYKDKDLIVSENKYKNKLNEMLFDSGYTTNQKYKKNILKLCDLGRMFLVKSKNELLSISNKYSLVPIDDELDIALDLINWGKISLDESNLLDYADMIYLPNVLNVKVFKYDYIIIDEAQDLSISQMSLFMKCFKQGSRFIAVGDENQCINAFAGSDIESFNKLRKLPNTIELPLSICYRCAKNIVKFAQKIVPDIEYNENSIDGYVNFKSKIDDLIDGDMVICRNTTPLIKLYVQLLSKGVRCYLKGSDIGLNLLDLIQDIDSEDLSEVFMHLTKSLKQYIDTNVELLNISSEDVCLTQEYNDFVDKIECLEIIGSDIKTKTQLAEKVLSIFSDENKEGICLSTIHKSKGLEADNVYVLNKNLIPSKYAKQEWERKQEQNLEYVAYTRAKKTLGFIYYNS